MNSNKHSNESGFSMIELMVAMLITLIVTGAIFGLLSSGQSAFKVQPERTDRQQNIRQAMDLITRDVAAAGVGMPTFIQTFKTGLDGVGQTSPFGGNTDELEMVTNSSGFSNESVCSDSSGATVLVRKGSATFPSGTPVMLIFANGTWTVRNANAVAAGSSSTDAACTTSNHVAVTLDATACSPSGTGLGNAGSANVRLTTCAGASPCCTLDPASGLGFGEVVHYRINNGSDGIPNLERSVNGAAFQIVARGVEDMQVTYRAQSNVPPNPATPNAPVVDPLFATYSTLITQVDVTLSSRAISTKIQGATYATGTTGAALRGSLNAQITPRQALSTLTTETGTPKWN